MGTVQGRPLGGAPCLGVGRPVSDAHPRATARPWGVRPGPATHWLWVQGVWAWGPVSDPTACALASWLCALWERHEGAQGGASLAWVWGVRGSTLIHARPPVLGACGRGPLPAGCGCGACGRGDPSPTPRRALLRAGFARCAGGTRAPVGRRLLPGCGAYGAGRSPTPDRLSLERAAGAYYPLAVGAGGVGVGTRHLPHSARSCELALCAVGAARGHPGGGASCLGMGRPGRGAHPRPTARPWGVRPGRATHWLWVRGVWAWGPVTNSTARALASWLCALWGRHKGTLGGAPFAWVWGVRGWALSHARPPVLGACGRGPLPTGF